MFLGHFWAYVRQPHGHIGWATPMPFAWINPTNQRTNPWNFHEKILRIGDFEKLSFFESTILNSFFQKKCFILMKTSQRLLVSKNGSSQTWQHFLTETKHFAPEFIVIWLFASLAAQFLVKCFSSNRKHTHFCVFLFISVSLWPWSLVTKFSSML